MHTKYLDSAYVALALASWSKISPVTKDAAISRYCDVCFLHQVLLPDDFIDHLHHDLSQLSDVEHVSTPPCPALPCPTIIRAIIKPPFI